MLRSPIVAIAPVKTGIHLNVLDPSQLVLFLLIILKRVVWCMQAVSSPVD